MNGFQEEIHPSSSSGCRNLRGTTQGYAVITDCFQQSYTINAPVTSVLSGPIDNPARDAMGISSTTLLCSPTKGCPPLFINSLKSQMNRLTVSSMTRHNQFNPPSYSVKKIPADSSFTLKKCRVKM